MDLDQINLPTNEVTVLKKKKESLFSFGLKSKHPWNRLAHPSTRLLSAPARKSDSLRKIWGNSQEHLGNAIATRMKHNMEEVNLPEISKARQVKTRTWNRVSIFPRTTPIAACFFFKKCIPQTSEAKARKEICLHRRKSPWRTLPSIQLFFWGVLHQRVLSSATPACAGYLL